MRKVSKPENALVIKLLKYFEKISIHFADHVITVTDLWRNKLISRSVPAYKCTSILNVPDDGIFTPYATKNKTSNNSRLVLSYHGSLEEHFGVDLLLEVMPSVRSQIPNIELVIYGVGRLKKNIIDKVRKNRMGDYVHINDGVPFYTLPMVLQNSDIGVVPTKDNVFSGEALSMKALEYMSLGIPVIISRTPAHSYYYDDSMVKFFIPCDKKDITKAIVELCEDNIARQELVDNAKIFIMEHGWHREKEKYFKIIDKLLAMRCMES